jgi:hypothetical protein
MEETKEKMIRERGKMDVDGIRGQREGAREERCCKGVRGIGEAK